MKCTISHFIYDFFLCQLILNTAWFYVHVWCSALADKTTSSVELYWLSELLCPMITPLSAWKFHYVIKDSKMEVAIIFWNFHSQLGFVVKEVEDVREKGESLKWACAERSFRKGVNMSKVFFRKNFAWQNLCVIFVKSKKITAEVMFALCMSKSLQSGKFLPNP